MHPVTIIGTGIAGVTLARELRKRDSNLPLRLVTLDDGHFSSKPTLSNGLARNKTAEQLIMTRRDALAAELNAEILTGCAVTAIDATGHRISTSLGDFDYSRLVLASGARPVRLAIEGDGADDLLSVNSLTDYERYRARLDGCRHVALIGAGLIGCEFANDLCLGGFAVTVYDLASQPLGRLLPPVAAGRLTEKLAEAGVSFKLGRSVARIDRANMDGEGNHYRLTDDQGDVVTADLVLSVVGLVADTGLARDAGIACGRAIMTDRNMQTSAQDIFALGDAVEIEGLHLPYVAPIQIQAKALAARLTGEPAPLSYPPMPVVVKTPACPTAVCPPPANVSGSWTEEATDQGVRAVFIDDSGKTRGFALLGNAVMQRPALLAELPLLLA